MFLGRGFAHIGFPPLYVGEVVLVLGLLAAGTVLVRTGRWLPRSRIVWLLLAFMALGLLRTVPYLGQYGIDALRDGVLWGYAAFALIIYILADRAIVDRAFHLYGRIVPAFAVWLPISWLVSDILSRQINPLSPGEGVPLVFFKSGDMAVHVVGAIGFLILGAASARLVRPFVLRTLFIVPLLWAAFLTATSGRAALLAVGAGGVLLAILAPAARRSRNWLPVIAASLVLVLFSASGLPAMVPSLVPQASPTGAGSPSLPLGSPSLPLGSPSSSPVTSWTPPPSASPGIGSPLTTPSPQPSPGSLVANPGFEEGTVGAGTIVGWTPFGVGTYKVVAGDAYRGSNFLSVDNTGGSYQATLTSDRFPFVAGEDISVSLRVKAIAGRPIVETYVNWYDNLGRKIATVPLKRFATGGAPTWQESSGALTAPDHTAEAEILLYEAAGRATMGIDDVMVRSGDFITVPPQEGRPATIDQLIDNIRSLFGLSSAGGLEYTRQFRLAWWGKIIDYTFFGPYFWTGKGFGINLADDDGFQINPDHSLRAPHNTHLTALARMGVPGFVLWLLLQGAFGLGLLRSIIASHRAGDQALVAIGGWILVYWVAMMVDTTFDPYLEGPQGGIWFWTLFGLGLAVMRLAPRQRKA